MANFRYSLIKFVFGCNLIFLVYSNPVNISLHSVNKSLIETALHSLNENSPTHHTYTGGQLISAEKLDELSHVIYRLTFNLSPICKETGEFCPTEACTINIKQDEYGDIQVQRDSIQCTYLYPQSSQNSEVPDQKEETNYENQESMDNLNKQIIQNGSNTPDKEIKFIGDQNDPQIISVKTSNSNYCPGCPYDLNTHLPGFIAFKREIEKQMDEILSNNFKHMVVEIVRATRSVPPSSNVIKFQLLVKVGESSCLKNLLTSISDCTLQSNVPIKTCLVTFEEQPLKHDTRQITKNNCTAISTVDFNKAKNLLNESYIIAKNDAYEGLKSIIADDLTYTSTYNTQNEKSPVTEHSFVKVLINKTKDEEKPENFTDKIKEFQEFLEDFDIPIKKHVNSDSKKSTINELKMVSEEISLNNNDDQNNIDSNLSSDNTKRSYSSDVYDVSSRKKRQLVGAPSNTNVNDPEIIEYANLGLKKFSQNLESTNEPIIVEIIEATSQVVSGMLYKIKAKLGISDCTKGTKNNCKLQEGSDLTECLFTIWSQPWVDKGSPNVKVDCNNAGRSKRHLEGAVYSQQSLAKEKNVISGEILLHNKSDQLSDETNIDSNLPSENTKRSYSSDVYDVVTRKKRQLVGAPSNTNVNDPEIIEYANLGLKKFSQNLESTNEPIIVEIIEATSQVVSGMLYKIKAKLGISDCTKGTKNNCKLQEGSDLTECLFTIWSQPWVDKGSPNVKVDCNNAGRSKRHLEGAVYSQQSLAKEKNVISEEILLNNKTDQLSDETNIDPNLPSDNTKKCYSPDIYDVASRKKRQIPGAPSNTNVNDPEIIEYANLGLKKFSQNLESTNEPIIVEILEATSQVVSGMLYKIKAKLGISDCTKGTKNNCKLQEGSDLTECLFTIWSQPWVDEGSPSVQVDCNDAARTKRHLKGAGYNQKMLAQAESIKHERKFEEFIINFNKNYLSEDEKMHRFKIFKENLKEIERFRRYELGTAEYGVTMFADLTYEEFKKQYLGLRPDLQLENHIPMQQAKIPDIELPVEYDWRHYDAVTPVKDQGQCGSCWAFSVTGNVEGQYAIKHGKLLSLSEQELLDCDKLDDACDGGLPDNAYRAIESLGGLELETDYPYKARNEKCNFNEKKTKVEVVSAVNITSNETQMAQWLVKNGPVSIGINANAMQFYVGGVSHPFTFLCYPKDLDHGVLIVGYGISKYPLFKKELPYWIIKNSWGPNWGESGYYRVYRGDGTCGVNQMVTSAVVE